MVCSQRYIKEAKIWSQIATHSAELSQHLDSFGKILVQMRLSLSSLEDVAYSFHDNLIKIGVGEDNQPLFLVSPAMELASLAREIVNMHSKELSVKCAIADDLSRGGEAASSANATNLSGNSNTTRTALGAYLSAWTLQLYLDDARLQEIDCIFRTESVLGADAPP
mmetsp:Transcript_10932/g.30599  ORF Transcript_10932/g.30599 Transcript_10932/m.30599 type:complete len:166 (+) Transcript_10932:50-547(+)